MDKSRSIWFLCGILVLLLLVGCANGAANSEDGSGPDEQNQNIGTLTVYASENYKAALQQVFSHLNLAQTEFRVNWSEDIATADVVITDNLPPQSHGDYRVLQPEKLQVQGIEQLAVRSEQGVIGLPVFLQLDGFWYDQLLYDSSGIEVPQSLDSWQACSFRDQYPVLCDEADMCALFWSVAAPYYLKSGGSTQELAEGAFQYERLLETLKVLEGMRDDGGIQLSEQAQQSFTAAQAAYWVTGVNHVAAYYNHMSGHSSWKISLSLPFASQEKAVCVVRADVLAVRENTDAELAEQFLELFFTQQVLADLSAYSRMPLACHMNYAPEVVPALPQVCYTLLSSPTVDVVQVPCLWSENKQQQVYDLLLSLMNGTINATQAAEQMLQ